MVLLYTTREGETIQYYDVISVYPYVCTFHVGHHKIHVGDAFRDKQAMLSKEVLIKCTVIPPKRLYHQVLPYRSNNKLFMVYAGRAQLNANFGRMRTRIDSAKVSNVNMGP